MSSNRKIEELGVVNPAAAEEYRELEQRHSLLVGQLETFAAPSPT